MFGEFRFVRSVCSGQVDLYVRLELHEADTFFVNSENPIDPQVMRCLSAGAHAALNDSGRYPMAVKILTYENRGHGDNWGAINTASRAATNHALGLHHLLPSNVQVHEP